MKKDFITLLVLIGLSIGCSFAFYQCKKTPNTISTETPVQGSNEVWIENMAFNPSSITVTVNSTVKWTNKDAPTHTATSTTGLFDSGGINNGMSFTHQFTSAGTYPYICTIHKGMIGTVIVQ